VPELEIIVKLDEHVTNEELDSQRFREPMTRATRAVTLKESAKSAELEQRK
jgi:hypothetical protein